MKYAARHDRLVDKIAERLIDKPYVDSLVTKVEYSRGELDIHTQQGNKFIYYEIKSSNSVESFIKAQNQLMRWTSYKHRKFPHLDFYGVYICPDDTRIICKNDHYRI